MGLFSAAKKLTDAFFDGLQKNTADRFIHNAMKANMKREAMEKEQQKQRDKEELERILKGDY